MRLAIDTEGLGSWTSLRHAFICDTYIPLTRAKAQSKALITAPVLLLNEYEPRSRIIGKYINFKRSSPMEVDRSGRAELQLCVCARVRVCARVCDLPKSSVMKRFLCSVVRKLNVCVCICVYLRGGREGMG